MGGHTRPEPSLKQDKLRRVQLNSEEYFDLLAKHPETASWLALGRNMLLAHNDDLIEILE